VSDPPTATLPEVVKVERVVAPKVVVPAFNVPKLVNPVTFNPFNAPKPVIDPPTPMFPVVVILFTFVKENPPPLISEVQGV
jgi:hypothetical protein